MRISRRSVVGALAALPTVGMAPWRSAWAGEQRILRVVMHSPLKVTDPIITTAYIARNHGYMIYDTLFAVDERMQVQPQMVGAWRVSEDKLTYSFILRDGLKWHDGPPVTAEDCIASIRRWGKRDSMGQKLMEFTKDLVADGEKSFRLILKEPYGLVLASLGKPSSNTPFMMPKRMAETPADQNVKEEIGSGPFKLVAAEFVPGEKVVYVRNADYVPRAEEPSWLAGAKVAKVDRVEWVNISDYGIAVNALAKGEIDFIEALPHDLLPVVQKDKAIRVENLNPLGFSGMARMNWLYKPFDNIKIRQAVLYVTSERDYLEAEVGNPNYMKECPALFGCGTPLETAAGAPKRPDLDRARQLLKEGGYDGTPVVIMEPTDLAIVSPLALVTAQALEKIGMTVDLQAMDWQTLVGRRARQDPPSEHGWNMFHTVWANVDLLNPVTNAGVNGRGKAGGWFGWAEDAEIEKLRDAYARETDAENQKSIAEAVQKRAYELVMYVPTGQYTQPYAYRAELSGIMAGPVPVFWNVAKG
jgi:peptide/nickel transport system substrate-binding protein